MRHEGSTRMGRMVSGFARTVAVGGVAALVGAQLFSLPVSTASAGGFGETGRAGGQIPAYCYAASNLNLQVTNALNGTLPTPANAAHFASAIRLGVVGGSQQFNLTSGRQGYLITVSFVDRFGNLETRTVGPNNNFNIPKARLTRGTSTVFTVTGTYNCSNGGTRVATTRFTYFRPAAR